MFLPRREVSQLAIIPVVRHPHLRPDEEDLFVVDDNPAVIDYVLVYYRPGDAWFSQGPNIRKINHRKKGFGER